MVDCRGQIMHVGVIEMSLCRAVYPNMVVILIDLPDACPLMTWRYILTRVKNESKQHIRKRGIVN